MIGNTISIQLKGNISAETIGERHISEVLTQKNFKIKTNGENFNFVYF